MNKNGLTLVEVVIAALILVVSVAGVLFMFSMESSSVARTEHRMLAMNFCRQTLDELRNDVGADTWESTDFADGTYAQALPAGSELLKFPPLVPPDRQYTVAPVTGIPSGSGYKSVTVEVNWEEPK